MKVIFMGTSSFACPTLNSIFNDAKNEIVAVYTKEPKISGRGQKIQNSPIHSLALKLNLPVYTPKTLREELIQEEFRNLKSDLAIVVSYGLLLPKEILESTKYGCFNVHPSALPKWRGASPIQRTIMSGDRNTSVCIIKMDEGLDSGDIVMEESIALNGKEHYLDLATKASEIGAKLIVKTIEKISQNNLSYKKQDHSLATYAKKIDKNECLILWEESAELIVRKIRGLSGSLGAYFCYDGEKIKILDAEFLSDEKIKKSIDNKKCGEIFDNQLSIICADGLIFPKIIQREGKKAMKIDEFLRGFKFEIGKILS